MSLDIDWSLLSSSDPTSLISLLNKQLSSTSRPSFIGPISITSFSYGTQGPCVEIRDIRDVWRVFDQGDQEGDLDLEEDERKKRDEERERDLDGLDGKYEVVDLPYDPILSPNGNGNGNGRYEDEGEIEHGHAYDTNSNSRYKRQSYNAPTSRPHPHGRPTSMPPTSFTSHYPLPYAYTPHLPSTPGIGLSPSMSMFSNFNGNGPLGMSMGRGPGSAASVVGVGLGSASLSLGGRRPLSVAAFPPGQGQGSQYGNGRPTARTRQNTQTQTRTSSVPTSPPARPLDPNPNAKDTESSKPSSVPSLQLHLHVSHSSDLQITLLTSLQVNYPSKSFMALPLKLVVTGFTLDAEVILAFNGDKNRLHLTVVDEDGVGSSGEHLLSPSSTSSDLSMPIPSGVGRMGGEKAIPIGQRLLPNLQIESEIGHADAHVLRNVGKVERFIVDVVRKTLVEELVLPNFHTVEL